MLDTLLSDAIDSLRTQWGTVMAAPGPFFIALFLATALLSYICYRYLEGKNRDQNALLQATVSYQKELLADYRSKNVQAQEKIEEITKKPDLRLHVDSGNIFIPDAQDVKDRLSGIQLDVSVWNIGGPSVAITWKLTVCPPGQTPVIAQHTAIPAQLNAGGPINSATIRGSNSLAEKTRQSIIGMTPETGALLFYVALPKQFITVPDTRLELSVSDILGKETVYVQRMGDWLQR